jgi:type I restriction enzyme S subunit
MNIEILLRNVQTLVTTPSDVAKLRQLILALAVQGKLVPQDNHGFIKVDENNSDTNFSNLPISWTLKLLEDTTDIIRGVTFPGNVKSRTRDSKYVACLRTASVQKSIDWDDLIYIPEEYVKNTSQWIKKNDIVISMANSYELVGKVAIVRDVPEKATFGAFLGVIRSTILDAEFLMIVLSCPIIQSLFRESSSQTTNIANISLSKLRNISIPVPPLAEQRRIVARVDELMALCDQLEAQLRTRQQRQGEIVAAALARASVAPTPEHVATLFTPGLQVAPAQLRQLILALAVQGKLVPQDAGKAQEWLKVAIEDVCDEIVDCPHSTAKFTTSGYLCLDTNSFKKHKLIDSKLRYVSEDTFRERIKRLKPQAGDIIFAREGSVGESYIVPSGMVCCLGQRVMLFRLSEKMIPEFFILALEDDLFLTQLLSLHKGIGAKHVNVSDMKRARIPLPPLAEQRRIVARVDELMALVDQLEAQQARAQVTASTLLEALVAGVGGV